MDGLSATAVLQGLTTRWLGQSIQFFPEMDSSNDFLKERVRRGTLDDPPAGHMVLTEYQRRGRGRLDRRWEAPPGSSLLVSLLFRPDWPAEQANWLTMIVSVAAAETIAQQTGLAARLKWPNDILVQQANRWYKVSGILQEGSFTTEGHLEWAIVGVGLNVNIPASQLPEGPVRATSLLVATGKPVPRLPLLAAFLARVEEMYEGVENGRSPHPIWQEKLVTLGQSVQVVEAQSGQSLRGLAVGTNSAGHLLVRDKAGRRHTVTAADVTLHNN